MVDDESAATLFHQHLGFVRKGCVDVRSSHESGEDDGEHMTSNGMKYQCSTRANDEWSAPIFCVKK